MHDNSENDDELDLPPSKTQRKQEMHALQEMGEQLVEFDTKQLNELALPEILMSAIMEAKLIRKHGARRRQMQYIGKLMRKIDVTPFQDKLASWRNGTQEHIAWLHQLEHWRTRLLADNQAFTELAQKYPTADIPHLRRLVRNAHKEKKAEKPPKSFRAIFRELQTAIPEFQNPPPGLT